VLKALLSGLVADSVPAEDIVFERFESWFIGGQFPSSTYLASATAVFVAGGPWLSRRWRRAGWIFLALAVAARVLTATEVPIRIGMLLTLGAAAGSLALLIFGAPRRRVDITTVAVALEAAGFAIDDVQPRGDDGTKFVAHGDDVDVFVKASGRARSASLTRYWRHLFRMPRAHTIL
jgi:hypothetical protein